MGHRLKSPLKKIKIHLEPKLQAVDIDFEKEIISFYLAWNDDAERWEFQNFYIGYYLEYALSLARN